MNFTACEGKGDNTLTRLVGFLPGIHEGITSRCSLNAIHPDMRPRVPRFEVNAKMRED